MTYLDELHASQRDHVHTAADAALAVFLAAQDIHTVRLDLAPVTPLETRILAHQPRSNA